MSVIIIQAIEGVSLEIIHYVVGQVAPLEAQAHCFTDRSKSRAHTSP